VARRVRGRGSSRRLFLDFGRQGGWGRVGCEILGADPMFWMLHKSTLISVAHPVDWLRVLCAFGNYVFGAEAALSECRGEGGFGGVPTVPDCPGGAALVSPRSSSLWLLE